MSFSCLKNKLRLFLFFLTFLFILPFSASAQVTESPTIVIFPPTLDSSQNFLTVDLYGLTGGQKDLCAGVPGDPVLYTGFSFPVQNAFATIDGIPSGTINNEIDLQGNPGDCQNNTFISDTYSDKDDGSDVLDVSSFTNGSHLLEVCYQYGPLRSCRPKIFTINRQGPPPPPPPPPPTGTVAVVANIPTSWTITGPANYFDPGNTSATYPNSPVSPPDYTISNVPTPITVSGTTYNL